MTLIGLDVGTRVLASGVGNVTTAGTPVQLSAQRCKRVLVQMLESEADGAKLVIGDSNVDALSDPIRGRFLFPTQAEAFRAHDASEIYVDATVDGLKFTYVVEG